MAEYKHKGYTIRKITKRDWVIYDQDDNFEGQLNGTQPGSPYKDISETLKEAKARIDALEA